MWVRSRPSNDDVVLSEVTRFNETVDQAIAEIIRRYADRSERYSDSSILSRSPNLNNIRLSGDFEGGGTLQEAQSVSTARILRGVRKALID